jgi:valyl-tRNA synthetase
MAKPRFNDEAQKDTAVSVLNAVLKDTLKLLHPFMPFITEEIYQSLPGTEGSIMLSDWPKTGKKYKAEEKAMEAVMEMIRGIRNIRAEMNVPTGRKAKLLLLASPDARADYEMCAQYIERLASVSEIVWISDKSSVPEHAVSVIGTGAEAFMPLGDLIDIAKEIERLAAEEKRLQGEIARAEGKLNNSGFTGKAPAEVVQQEREKLENYKEQLAAAQHRRIQLQ